MLDAVSTAPHDVALLLDLAEQRSAGDPSPSHTVAPRYGLSPDAARKRAQRVRDRAHDFIAAHPEYGDLAELPVLAKANGPAQVTGRLSASTLASVPCPAVEVDVAVVGAGPAGSAAAITLAQAGASVALVDKATFPRDKCCGDGLTTGALRLLEQLGVSPLSLPSWQSVDAAWVRSPSGRVVELPLPSGRGVYAAVVRRTELDALLVDRARDAGAEVHEGSTLTGVRTTADAIELDVDEVGTISARMAIGADGMWSPLRKMLGAGRSRATSASGMRSASTSPRSVPRRRLSCGCGSSPTSCRATRGRSHSPDGGPTWASASRAVARSPPRR